MTINKNVTKIIFFIGFWAVFYSQAVLWRNYLAERTGRQPELNFMNAQYHFQRGIEYGSEEELYKAVKLDPTNPHTHHKLASYYVSFYAGARLDRAYEEYRKAMLFADEKFLSKILQDAYDNAQNIQRLKEIVPNTGKARYLFAEFLRDKNIYDEAILEFKQAALMSGQARNNKILAGSYNWIAIIYMWQGRFADAVEYFDKAYFCARENVLKSGILRNLGNTYAGMEDFKKAESACKKSIESDPSAAANYYTLGNVYDKIGLPRQARDCYYTALKFTNDRYLLEQISKKLKEINS